MEASETAWITEIIHGIISPQICNQLGKF